MKRFFNTPRAEADLEEIADYFAARNPDAGLRLFDAITARCRQLANQPGQGQSRDNLGAGIRSVVVKGYLIYFRATPTGIDVLRVLHGARDVDASLFDG